MASKSKKEPQLNFAKLEKIANEIITAGQFSAELSMNQMLTKLKTFSVNTKVASNFHEQVLQIDKLLGNDTTGIVNTILEFQITSGTVPFTYVTDNTKLTEIFNNWSKNVINKNVSLDIPVGQLELSGQYNRERLRSSFLVLNIIWDDIDGYILPSRMFFSNGGAVTVESDNNAINGKKYLINKKPLRNTKRKSYIIRKPYNLWHEDYPTPYLVKKGVLYNALLKTAVVEKQGDILEEIIPYLLLLRGGDKELVKSKMLGDIDKQLTDLKDALKNAKRNKKFRTGEGDTIMKGRYDLQLDHIIPDLSKIFDTKIVKPMNNDMLFGLGLVELEGFSSTRTEAILNPKVLIAEIVDSVRDLKLLYDDVTRAIIEKNIDRHPKLANRIIRAVPGVIKPILTDNMLKLIKSYADTGQLSIQDSFEAMPDGFDFEINKMRREKERKDGLEDLFFPRPILNQNSDDQHGMPRQNVTPQEVPKKASVNKNKLITKCSECDTMLDYLSIAESGMGYIKCPECNNTITQKDAQNTSKQNVIAVYDKNSDLPDSVKVLPAKAQTIFRKAFNTAIKDNDEESSFKIGWVAVKKKYKRTKSGTWVLKT